MLFDNTTHHNCTHVFLSLYLFLFFCTVTQLYRCFQIFGQGCVHCLTESRETVTTGKHWLMAKSPMVSLLVFLSYFTFCLHFFHCVCYITQHFLGRGIFLTNVAHLGEGVGILSLMCWLCRIKASIYGKYTDHGDGWQYIARIFFTSFWFLCVPQFLI